MDYYSRIYAQNIEQLTFPMAVILFNSLNINEATNVLEIGTGNGQNLQYYIQNKPESCHWCATDISETMLSICQQRIEEFLINPVQKIKHDYLIEEIPKFVEKSIPDINVSFKKADASNLSQFKSDTFDRFMAVLVLSYKSVQQEQMLKEAFRVVKSGGLLGFTVFGRKQNSPFQNEYKEIAIKLGIDKQNFGEDIFDSHHKDNLLPRMEKIGYKILKAFYVCVPIDDIQKKVEAYLAEGSMKRQVLINAGASEELIKKITLMTIEKFKQYELENKAPITMEVLFIIAQK